MLKISAMLDNNGYDLISLEKRRLPRPATMKILFEKKIIFSAGSFRNKKKKKKIKNNKYICI